MVYSGRKHLGNYVNAILSVVEEKSEAEWNDGEAERPRPFDINAEEIAGRKLVVSLNVDKSVQLRILRSARAPLQLLAVPLAARG